jgi:hypothetical protein
MRNLTMTSQAWPLDQINGYAVPVIGRVRTDVCALAMTTGVVPAADQDSSVLPALEGTDVAGHGRGTETAFVKGAFPGDNAWSPPI